jgi:hypothetical protein
MITLSSNSYLILAYIGSGFAGLAQLGKGRIDRWIYRCIAIFMMASATCGYRFDGRLPFMNWISMGLFCLLIVLSAGVDIPGVSSRRMHVGDLKNVVFVAGIAAIIISIALFI